MACSFLNKIVFPYTYYTGSGESNNNLLGIEVSSNLITVEVSYDSGSTWTAVTDSSNLNFDPNNYYGDLPTSMVNALNAGVSAQGFFADIWFRDAANTGVICKYKSFIVSRANGNGFQGATVLLQCNGNDTANLIINTCVYENFNNEGGLNSITLSGVPGFSGVTPTYISSGAAKTAVWTFSNIPINTGTSADILNLVFTSPGETNLTFSYNTTGLCTPASTTTSTTSTTTTSTTTSTTTTSTTTTTTSTTTSSTPSITAYDFNLGTSQQGSVGGDINFPNPVVTNCTFSGNFQLATALPTGASWLVNGSAIGLDTSFTNADDVRLQVVPGAPTGVFTFNYRVLGDCGNDTATITITISAAPTTTSTSTSTTSTSTTSTTSTSTTTTTTNGTIISISVSAGNITAGNSTSDIILPVPNVTDNCTFTGSYKLTNIAAYGLLLKNGVPMNVGTIFNNTDLIQISTSATDIVGGYSFSYKSIGTCGESANALITYNIVAVPTTTVVTTTSNLPDVKNQTVSVPIGTRGQLNISTGDRPCNTGFTSYAIKNGSIIGLLNVELIDNIAYFDVIGALGYFTKQLYCSGLLVDEAVVTVEGTPNTTIPCGCSPCTNQNQQPIWQFFKQLGNTYIYKDINSCSPTYGNTESRNSCTPITNANCGCS